MVLAALFCFKRPNEIPHCWWIVIVVVAITRLGATLGKVMIAQTLVLGTQLDFDMLAVANGKGAFLDINDRTSCSSNGGGAIL